jgi:hypothetical protein
MSDLESPHLGCPRTLPTARLELLPAVHVTTAITGDPVLAVRVS